MQLTAAAALPAVLLLLQPSMFYVLQAPAELHKWYLTG
jgi:hypothetical protein